LNELPLLNGLTEQKPRQIAAQVLQRRSSSTDFVEDILEAALVRSPLSTLDRGLCQELVYGVVRWQAALDWLIARKTPGRSQKPMLQTLLRLGLYQIFWLDRIPNHAAVNETVEQAKQSGFGPQAGFINAILRGYLREFDATKAALVALKTTQPHLGYSHPEWLVARWQKRWGAEKAAQLMEWNNSPPKTFARINDLKFAAAPDADAGRARHSVRAVPSLGHPHDKTPATSPDAETTSPSPPRSGGLELLGKQRKESAKGGGPEGAVRAGASESLGRGEVVFRVRGENQLKKSAFVQLLEAVHAIEGLERIRFTSPHPKGYGDDLVEAYARLTKLCPSAHIPLQSGSDRLLKLMHRGYTRDRFLSIVKKLRAVQPRIGITTDIIVGFPGETEEDFEQTLEICREVEFDNAYLFKYSPRRDTPAASMPDQIPDDIKESRHARILELVNSIAARRYEAHVGQQMQILVEGPSRKNADRAMGRTRCNKIVLFDGSPRHHGQLMDVKITRTGSFTLYGDPAILE
jgi:transcription termination factor NusB